MALNDEDTRKISHLPQLSPEDRKRLSDRANAAKRALYEAREASTLRRDFLDSGLWDDLARARGLRLPPWGKPATVSNMRTFLHKTGSTQAQFEDWAGCGLAAFIGRNPLWPLRAIAGVILEQQEATCKTTTE